jgi:P22 coat protein - gene protein 5
MPNLFNKEERVLFDKALLAFEDDLVLSNEVDMMSTSAQEMERSSNIVWVPQPYVAASYDGLDQTANFKDIVQLSVPMSFGFSKSVPWTMSATDLNDSLQNGNFGKAARQKLASDINVAVSNIVCLQGAQVVKRTAAASGYDDVAECDALLTEQGVQRYGRKMVLHTRQYNGMASNLAARGTMTGKPSEAYETNYVGQVAGFKTFDAGYTLALTAAAGVTVTINGANQRYVPRATSTAGTGETNNVDNRFQNITIAVTSGTVKVGDAFTIAGVNAVHHITKQSTGRLKTFRITAIVSGAGGSGVVTITPPIIAADSAPTPAEVQYKNCTATPATGAAVTFLNTATGNVAPFWVQEAVKLLPARYSPVEDSGLSIMRGSTKQGIELLMTKQGAINDLSAKYRMDVRFGCVLAQPDMAGIAMFSQP